MILWGFMQPMYSWMDIALKACFFLCIFCLLSVNLPYKLPKVRRVKDCVCFSTVQQLGLVTLRFSQFFK